MTSNRRTFREDDSERLTACCQFSQLARSFWPLLIGLAALLPLTALFGDEAINRLLSAAEKATRAGDHKKASELLGEAIQQKPDLASAYYRRGRARFRLGQFKAAVADFDKFVKLAPKVESRQWERGIAQYYAGQFENGAKQFELYQTYHDNDVENSVWRYLCMAPTTGVKKAQAVMLPIRNDRRVPMMQVYEMFRGNLSPDEVLAAVEKGDPTAEERDGRLFYARLYLGLYYEANKKQDLAEKYILLAADKHRDSTRINNYMWAVADVHAKRIRRQRKQRQEKKPEAQK